MHYKTWIRILGSTRQFFGCSAAGFVGTVRYRYMQCRFLVTVLVRRYRYYQGFRARAVPVVNRCLRVDRYRFVTVPLTSACSTCQREKV
jgi:hypothetical protein